MNILAQQVKVELKRKFFFDPASLAREVELYDSKDRVICHPDNKKGIKGIRTIIGKHVGDRAGFIKVRPRKQIFEDQFADYFIIKETQIKTIEEI